MGLPIAYQWLADLSKSIMNYYGRDGHNYPELITKTRKEPRQSTAEATYLLPRSLQRYVFLQNGYIEGTPGDYGLVKKAVGNRNTPVYQTYPDKISRDELAVLGNYTDSNPMNYNISNDASLVNAGNFPTAIYVDADGNLYQKSWDLNDYGNSREGNGRSYGNEQWKANLADIIGSPVVVTTGFQPLIDFEGNQLNLSNYDKPHIYVHGHQVIDKFIKDRNLKNYDGQMIQELPEVIVTNKQGGKLIKRKRYLK